MKKEWKKIPKIKSEKKSIKKVKKYQQTRVMKLKIKIKDYRFNDEIKNKLKFDKGANN
jgi:hypothetical protein